MAKTQRQIFCYNWLCSKAQFSRLTGVSRAQFEAMLTRPRPLWDREVVAKKKKSGRPWDIADANGDGLADHLLVLLILYRCHITQDFMGCLYGVDKSAICRAKARIEPIAARVLGVKQRIRVNREEAASLLVDCTEQPCQRPKRKQKCYYSGKKKRHTIKAEIIVARHEGKSRILSLPPPAPGSVHDLALRRRGPRLPPDARLYADSAYQGYQADHPNLDHPYKRPKGGRLSREEKEYNRALSSFRIAIEHVFGRMKCFRILKDIWRYPRKSWHRTARIIAGIVNIKAGFEPC